MTFLTITILLMYMLVAFVTIYGLRSNFLMAIRILSGIGFFIMVVSYLLPISGINDYMMLILALAIISSVEITAFKVRQDNRHLFLVHVFTAAMAIVFVIYLFVT